jgi:DNA-binding XRE family transcriptional regulator
MGNLSFTTDHPNASVRRLEVVRERLRFSQRRMAHALGVPHRTYQKWIAGRHQPRHADALLARANAIAGSRGANCWQVRQCNRQPGGEAAAVYGICPAATETRADGVNRGTNGGRICWAIPGTPCGFDLPGGPARKVISCLGCGFFRQVYAEEGLARFKLLLPGQKYLQD